MHASSADDETLQALERRTYRSWLEDGLVDVFLGLVLLIFAATFLTDVNFPGTEFDLPLLLLPLLPLLWGIARRSLVEPRAGYVKLREPLRKLLEKRWSSLSWLFALLVLCLALGMPLAGFEKGAEIKKLLAGFALAIPVALAGPFLEFRRWTLYAVVIAVAAGLEYFLGAPFGAGWMLAGGLILLTGLTVLLRFFRSYPAGEPHDV